MRMIYRVKQVVWAVKAQLTKEDYAFVARYLTGQEQHLFYQLKRYEQKHSIQVAQAMYKQWLGEEAFEGVYTQQQVIRLGLLHDIGKSVYPIGIIGKSIMVLGDHITKGRLSKYKKFKSVQCYYQHPQLGYTCLKPYVKEEMMLQLILRHHDTVADFKETGQGVTDNAIQLMTLLQKCDNAL